MTKPWDLTSEHLLRELAPQVLGTVARRFRDFSSAEDEVQEAMIDGRCGGRAMPFFFFCMDPMLTRTKLGSTSAGNEVLP
jgi:hypothetical protein